MVPRDKDVFGPASAPPAPATNRREEPVRSVSREAPVLPAKPPRLTSLDAYRGFIMLAMVSAGFYLSRVAPQYGDNWLWQVLGYETDHVAWTGCSFWDLIQPAFMFMVGVALPFSYASRRARGDSYGRALGHAALRAFILVVLGVFLSSNGSRQTNYTFVNVLSQIGLGYLFAFLLVDRGWTVQLTAAVLILAGYWYLFYQHPLPGPEFSNLAVNSHEGQHFKGLYAHWDKNANFAADADLRFLNLFPHAQKLPPEYVGLLGTAPAAGLSGVPWAAAVESSDPGLPERYRRFRYNEGGYQTLNFVPSLATMIFGLMAGEFLRRSLAGRTKFRVLLGAGVFCLFLGLLLDYSIWPRWIASRLDWVSRVEGTESVALFHVGPIVKRIWSPTWTIFSTGWALVMLAAFYWVIDLKGYRRWAFPLVVVGMNSITMYCMAQLMKGWVRQTLQTHLGQHLFDTRTLGPTILHHEIVSSAAILFVLWLICFWLYRQKIFVRI